MSSGDKYIFYPQNKPLESGWIIFLFWYKDVRRRQTNNSQMSQETEWVVITMLNPEFLQIENSLIKINQGPLPSISASNYSYKLSDWKTLVSPEREQSWAELNVGELLYWWGLAGQGWARLGQRERNNNHSANIHIMYLLDSTVILTPCTTDCCTNHSQLLLAHNPFVQLREIIWEKE